MTIPANLLLSKLTKKAAPADAPAVATAPTAEQVATERARLRLLDLLADIEALGLGLPALTGDAALAVSAARKQVSLSEIAGSGELADASIDSVADLDQVLNEARDIVAARAAEAATGTPEVVSDDAPEPTPAVPFVPGTTAVTPDPLAAIAAKTDAPKRRGRPKKVTPEADVTTSTDEVPVALVSAIPDTDAVGSVSVNVYIDCSTSFPTISLWPIVNIIIESMNVQSGAPDFRVADEKGPFGYGKWRGILANHLRDKLPPGTYSLDGAAGEIAQAVTETLREIVGKTNGVYVRGSR